MNFKFLAAAAVAAVGLAATACQQIPEDQTVVQYCSNPDNVNKDVCKVNVEIDGQKRALSETNMSLSQARQIADSALSRANSAQASAAKRWVIDSAVSRAWRRISSVIDAHGAGSDGSMTRSISKRQPV